MSVGFIGAGQLAHALVKGFTAAGKDFCEYLSVFQLFILVSIHQPGHLSFSQPKIPTYWKAQCYCMALEIMASDCNTAHIDIAVTTGTLYTVLLFLLNYMLFEQVLNISQVYTDQCIAMPFQMALPFFLSFFFEYLFIISSSSPSGVIAAHRITASSPDTDLPTVTGLRVRLSCVVF